MNPKSIEKQVAETIRAMGAIYGQPRRDKVKVEDRTGWSDGDGPQGLISTGEALECIFIPYWIVPGIAESLWAGNLVSHEIIAKSIEYLVEGYRDDPAVDGLMGLSGTPYIDFRKRKRLDGEPSGLKRNFDFVDTACFVLCALLDAKAVQIHGEWLARKAGRKFSPLYPSALDPRIDSRIVSCLKLMRECDLGPGQGWAFTNDEEESGRIDQLYFTWNVLETLEVVAQPGMLRLLPSLPGALTAGSSVNQYYPLLLRDKLGGLTARYLSPVDAPKTFIGGGMIEFGEGDKSYYYNLFAILSLIACGSSEKDFLCKALGILVKALATDDATNILHPDHGKFLLEGSTQKQHRWEWGERAFLPLFVKAMARFKQLMPESHHERLILQQFDQKRDAPSTLTGLMDQYLTRLDSLRMTQVPEFKAVWDSYRGYSIYFTERVIEALSRVYAAWFPDQVAASLSELDKALAERFAPPPLPERPEGRPPSVQITISSDVVSEAIKDRIQREIEALLSEAVRAGLANEIRVQVEKALGETSVAAEVTSITSSALLPGLKCLLGDLLTQVEENQFEPDHQKLYDALTNLLVRIASDRLERILYERLTSLKSEFENTVSLEDFNSRVAKAISFLLEREQVSAGKQKRVNYVGMLTNIYGQHGSEQEPPKNEPFGSRKR